jgi:hypothetical protein
MIGVREYIIIGLAVALLLAIGTATVGIHYYRSKYLVVKAEGEAFKAQTAALGEKAKADKIEKETKDAKRIADAESARDAALAKLRVEQARPRGGFVPSAAPGSKDPSRVCYERSPLDAALRKLDSGVSRLIGEGDAAIINGRAILNSWPTAQPIK